MKVTLDSRTINLSPPRHSANVIDYKITEAVGRDPAAQSRDACGLAVVMGRPLQSADDRPLPHTDQEPARPVKRGDPGASSSRCWTQVLNWTQQHLNEEVAATRSV